MSLNKEKKKKRISVFARQLNFTSDQEIVSIYWLF